MKIIPAMQDYLVSKGLAKSGQCEEHYRQAISLGLGNGSLSMNDDIKPIYRKELKRMKSVSSKSAAGIEPVGDKTMSGPTMQEINNAAGGSSSGDNVRVKRASERYKNVSGPIIRGNAAPIVVMGQEVQPTSELAYAKIGAFTKHYLAGRADQLKQAGAKVPVLNDHERDLLSELYHQDEFCGEINTKSYLDRGTLESGAGISPKALLNDAISNGSSLVPYEFDVAIITYPYLHSQILPYIDARTASSSQVKTAAFGQVSVHWGANEGTAIACFDTTSIVRPISADMHTLSAAFEWGKDFEADTPVADFGQKIVQEFGQANLKELDRVICLGDGVSQPEGIFTASGTVSVASAGGTGADNTYADYVKLQFGVGLEYRQQSSLNPCYISNDVTYQRSRTIQATVNTGMGNVMIGSAFGANPQSYSTATYRHAICPTLSNSKIAFACLGKYRFYRRSGFDFMITDQGSLLAKQNKKLMVMRQRVAGLVVDPNAFAIMPDAKA